MLFFFFCALILFFSIRGLPGNPTPVELNQFSWRDNGPFELSPERGRYALLYSLVENKSFSFTPELARFTVPDLAYSPQKGYVSLFAPAVSFMVIPGYLIGKSFGDAQFGAYAVIAFFALLNVLLIRAIALRLGAHSVAATIGGFAFLFASPSFAYAVNLYQHHISTFLILLSLYLLVRFNNILSLCLIWMLYALSVSVDYPNFFLMFPIAVAALGRAFIVKKDETRTHVFFSLGKFLTVVSVVIPLLFFFWSNTVSYGNPLQLAGGLTAVSDVAPDGSPIFVDRATAALKKTNADEPPPTKEAEPQRNVLNFFQNRNLMNGFYIHFFSPDRGILVYAPIMFFAILGIYFALKKRQKTILVIFGVLGANILLYSMWGDPYGGWAFGSRYLIPAYALLSLFIALALTRFKKNSIFLLIFFIVLSYSIAVNTMGAITSSRNPPQIQILSLEKDSGIKQEYTFLRNAQMLAAGQSKAFFFKTYMKNYVSAWNYYYILTVLIVFTAALLLIFLRFTKTKSEGGINEV